MQTEEILSHLDVEGYCVIEGVIPADEVGAVRASLAATMQKEYEAAMERAATVRAKGHRIGGAGVQAVPGILNLDQSFAPYLTDARITGAVRALFGDFYRISNIRDDFQEESARASTNGPLMYCQKPRTIDLHPAERRKPPVDRHDGPGDETRLVREQPQRGADDLGWVAEAGHGDIVDDGFAALG